MPIPKFSTQSLIQQAQAPVAPMPSETAQYIPQPDPAMLTPMDVAQAQQLYITQPKSQSTPPPMPPPVKGWKR